jgi:hypothetical protein
MIMLTQPDYPDDHNDKDDNHNQDDDDDGSKVSKGRSGCNSIYSNALYVMSRMCRLPSHVL